jgi:hypothetical protein
VTRDGRRFGVLAEMRIAGQANSGKPRIGDDMA